MKTMHFLTFLFLLLCCSLTDIQAANQYTLTGIIKDAKSQEPLPMAGIRLMTSDSTYVTGAASEANGTFSLKVAKKGKYILKFSSIGFLEKCINVTLSSQKEINLGDISLSVNDIALKETTVSIHVAPVQTSKDTFIYNAAAYRTPDGSTLEALVEKLPGAEVSDDGTIKINGKTVSQILIDGKDFFKGDTKVAMKNLPVDLVNKIKAYDKQSDYTKQTGIDDGNEETVLDVGLKQKLKSSWISNIDVALGNKDRYANKIFVTRFTDRSRIAAFGSINNINDQGFQNGSPNFLEGNRGLTASRSVGLAGHWHNGIKEDSAHYFQIGGDFRFNYNNTDNLTQSNSETFLTQGKSFSNSSSHSFNKNRNLNMGLNLEWNPDTATFVHFRPRFSHSSSDSHSNSLSATFNDDPYAVTGNPLDEIFAYNHPDSIMNSLKEISVNRNQRFSLGDSRSNNFSAEFNITRRLNKKGRSISFRGEGSYADSKSNTYSISDIYYFQRPTQAESYNNQFTFAPSKNWSYEARLSYSEPLWKNWFLQSSYGYEHKFSDRDRNLFQLDSLDGWGIGNMHPIGSLPSGDSLTWVRNLENSQYATYKDDIHRFNIGFRYVTKDINFSAGVRFQPQRTQLNYTKSALDTIVTRNVFNVAPNIRLRYTFNQFTRLELFYRGSSSQPSMTDLLDVTDNSDPLNISKGNPGLKPSWSNNFRLNFNTYKEKHQQSAFANINFTQTSNSISTAVTYDEATGARTSRPENINGNWNINGFMGYNRGYGKDNAFTSNATTFISFAHNVGYISVGTDNSRRNTVKDLNLGQLLRGTYRWNLFEASLFGHIMYNKSESRLQAQANMETYSFNYGASLQYTTPWNTSIATNMAMNSRRGYNDASMNTNELIWNLQLSQTFFNKSTTLSIQFYDLLHQQNSIRRSITAQMRSDTWFNGINSYFLVHLIYRLNIFGGQNGQIKSDRNRRNDRNMRQNNPMSQGKGGPPPSRIRM